MKMANSINTSTRFLGRPLDANTMTYSHGNNDYVFTEEDKQEFMVYHTSVNGNAWGCLDFIEKLKVKRSNT